MIGDDTFFSYITTLIITMAKAPHTLNNALHSLDDIRSLLSITMIPYHSLVLSDGEIHKTLQLLI